MSGPQEAAIKFDDDEHRSFHATWSRSGKRLIVTITTNLGHAQVELRPEQVDALNRFLSP